MNGVLPVRPADLMLYVHIPFCPSKCHFCGWVQGMSKRELLLSPADQLRSDYIAALCKEIRGRAAAVKRAGYRPNIVYWGGGTGSSLIEPEIEQVQAALAESYDLSQVTEATIEGSPDTLSAGKLRLLRQLGYTRLSLGIQSFNDQRLRRLGRVHNAASARAAIEAAAAAGFDDINIDLMCGLPEETEEEVIESVKIGVSLPVTHFSYYPYRPVNETVMQMQLNRGRTSIDATYQKRVYRLGRDLIAKAGFAPYAMSYFGRNSLNDLAVFRVRQDWLGFGCGAHSLMSGRSLVHARTQMREYIERPMVWHSSTLACSPEVAPMLLGQGLATFKGIDRRDWLERTGEPLEQSLSRPGVREYLDRFRENAGLVEDETGIRLDPEKMIDVFIDQLLAMA